MMLHAGPHAQLDIYIDGELLDLPEDIGIDAAGDRTGLVSTNSGEPAGHLSLDPVLPVTLDEFFDLWRENAGQAGNNPDSVLDQNQLLNRVVDANNALQMFVNGQRNAEFEQYQINDNDQITLVFGMDPVAVLNTNFGSILLQLYANQTPHHPATPITVDNFLNYFNDGDYDNSFFHRLVNNFVLQGGGFTTSDTTAANAQTTDVPTDPPIQNEFANYFKASGNNANITPNNAVIDLGEEVDLSQVVAGDRISLIGRLDGLVVERDPITNAIVRAEAFDILSVDDVNNTVTVQQTPTDAAPTPVEWQIFSPVNVRGTAAVAKLGGDPNSGTSQTFFSFGDNSLNLDYQNGGFTVFGQVLNMVVVDAMGAFGTQNLVAQTGNGALTNVPVSDGELVVIESVDGNASINGIAFQDVDDNDQFNAGDIRLPDITVFIDDNDSGVLDDGEQSTTTDANGNYFFHVVAGTYIVRQIPPDDFVQTSPSNPASRTVTVEIGENLAGVDFGNQEGTIHGVVYNDLNNSDVFDSGDVGLANVTVFIDANDNGALDDGEQSTTTVPDGSYVFLVADGTYIVRQVAPANFTQSFPLNPDSRTATVENGVQTSGVDFANVSARIVGAVFRDNDNDGVFNDGDEGLEGVTVFVDENDNSSLDDGEQSTTTDDGGSYAFSLEPGTHIIRQIVPTDFNQSFPLDPDSRTVTVGQGEEVTEVDFANAQNFVSGFVYVDSNNNGIREEGESPVAGVTIRLIDENDNQVGDAVTTGIDGSYRFTNLLPGTYRIVETQPQLLGDGIDTVGSQGGNNTVNDQLSEIIVTAITQGVENNFGERVAFLADYIMRRDQVSTMNERRFDDSILVAINSTTGAQIWSSLGTSWIDFVSVSVAATAQPSGDYQLTLSAERPNGDTSTETIQLHFPEEIVTRDERLRELGRIGDVIILRFIGTSEDFFN